jgi:type I restriction enzyme S subunit
MAAAEQKTLGEIADFMNGGAWSQTEYSDEGVSVVRVTDIKGETVDLAECKYLPQALLEKYARHLLQPGDLVICTVGSHPTQPGSVVGRAAVIPPSAQGSLLNQNAVRIRSALNDVDQEWLGYLGRSKPFHEYIISCARGSANQVRMAIGLLKEMPVEVPPLTTQRHIAGILSAYDELIENCQRRIKILETMARGLYREWFVHFRFPGHENVPLVPSSMGQIPQGWEVKAVKDILARRAAGTMYRDSELKQEGEIAVIDQSTNELLGFHDNCADHTASPESPLAIFGDHTCKMQLLIEPFSVGPNVVPFAADKGLPTAYVFYAVSSLVQTQEYKRHWSPLNAKEIVVADKMIAQRFASLIQPILIEQTTLRKVTRNLRRTRDLLLPRLLSGQIDVEALDCA